MTQEELKNKIADLEKRVKNPSLPASAVTALNKMIDDLKLQMVKQAMYPKIFPPKAGQSKEEPKKKVEPKAPKEPKVEPKPARKPKAKAEPKKEESVYDKLTSIDDKAMDLIDYKSGGIQTQSLDKIKKYVNYVYTEVSKLKTPLSNNVYEKLADENRHSLNITLGLLGFYKDYSSSSWAKSDAKYTDLVFACEKVKAAKKEEPKKEEPKKAEAKNNDDEYCRQLIAQERERRAKAKARAKERANEPKKTPATKNKEAVEKTTTRVATNVEKRADKGDVNAAEIEKLIKEYEDAIKKLKALLTKVKSGKKMQWGGTADSASSNDPMIGGTMASSLEEYAKGGTTKKKKRLKASEIIDNEYSALKSGERKSAKVAYVEMRGGTGYYRKNANQYVKAGKAGGREYTENRSNRADSKKYL